MRGCLKTAGLVALVMICIPGLVMAVMCLRGWYDMHLAPPEMRPPIVSPDGKYTAQMGYRSHSFDRKAILFLQEGKGRRYQVYELQAAMYCEAVWSPDSRRIAFYHPGRSSQEREFFKGPHWRTVQSLYYTVFAYDMRTHHSGYRRNSVDLDVPSDLVDEKIIWKWLDPNRLLISIQYPETRTKTANKPITLLTVTDTGAKIGITEKRLMRVRGIKS